MSSRIININILFSKEAEIERVKYVYKELDWYHEHGYDVRLPGGRLGKNKRTLSHDKLLFELEKEFTLDLYEQAVVKIRKSWRYIENCWPREEMEKTTLLFQSTYNIHLTRYGTGGSYHLPNEIVLNIDSSDEADFGKILFHEMIHLCIEPLIQKYNTPLWYKERIVDLTFRRLMPEIAFEQNLPKEALTADTHFAQNYGDFDKIFSNLGRNHESPQYPALENSILK